MYDKTIKLGNSIINHGEYNNRIYVMKLSKHDFPSIILDLDKLADENRYTKIFSKVPSFANEEFEKNGYMLEATIPKFYNGKEDVYFMSKFTDEDRKTTNETEIIKEVLDTANNKEALDSRPLLVNGYSCKICNKEDSEGMAKVYRTVFKTYPFPIHDEEYLKKTIDDNVVYFGIFLGNKLVSLSSSEMDDSSRTVEMTDFATLPDYTGNGFAVYLLDRMEDEMKNRGLLTAYTIARAVSFGMNITFSKMAYKYGGTLINNTNISGSIECMNVWYKYLN